MSGATAPGLEARIEAAFCGSAEALRRFAWLAAALMTVAFLANTVKIIVEINAPGYAGEAAFLDFTAFWAGARLALDGNALGAFDIEVFRDALKVPPGLAEGDIFWLYPPAWHIAVMPLGLLPFSAAYVAFCAVSIAAFVAAVRPVAGPLPGGVPLVVAAPAVLIVLTLGHNSLLWTAGLIGALAALAQGRAVLAGLLIALLTLKPQLGILIPVALVAGGHWRTILWASIGAAAIVALSTAVMGLEYWRYFFGMLRFIGEVMTTDLVRFGQMLSWYALMRLGGAPHELAYPIQLAVTVAAAGAVGWVWSRRRATPDLKAATLCAAIPLATPYVYHYDMILALAAALFLARDGFGATRGARLWLLALWLGPVPGLALLGYVPPGAYAAPLLTATLGLCLARASRGTARAPA